MRVACITPCQDPAVGAAHRMLSICAALLRSGVDVRVVMLDQGRRGRQPGKMLPFPEERVTRIACWNRRFHLAAPAVGTLGPVVASADVLLFSSFLWGPTPWAWLLARFLHRPWIVSPGGILPYFGRSLWLKRAAHVAFGARMLRRASALVAITELERRALLRYAKREEDVVVIPNGVETGDLSAGRARDTQEECTAGRPFALFLGRLNPVKGVDLLLRAFAAMAPAARGRLRLRIAGDGPERSRLKSLSRELGLEGDVELLGHVPAERKASLLRRSAFVVIPSRRDAMTQVVLEAATHGKPVLISSACGFPEAQACGGALEVEPEVESIRAGMESFLADWEELPAMGDKLRRLVVESYSWDTVAALHLGLFRKVLGR